MATTITANGINFPDGSAGSPSIGGSDTNTGLFTGADIIGFSTGGSERLRIDSSGNVGIGTTSPTGGKLHIAHGNELGLFTSGPYNFQAKFESTDAEAAIVIEDNGSTNDGNRIGVISDVMAFTTAGSERMRIDSSGRVGIGSTSPEGSGLDVTSSRSTNYSATADQRSLAHIIARNVSDNAGRFASISLVSGGGTQAEGSLNLIQTGSYVGAFAFKLRTGSGSNDWQERMRIDSAGRLLLNTSSSFDNEYRMSTYITSTGGHVFRPDGTSTRKPLAFQNNSGSEVGSISSSTSSTSFNTSSDYRLKENAVAISDGITRLKTLKPYKFNWISDDTNTPVDGFFAHEVSSAVPEAISGTKDAVDSDNKPVHQEIDQSKLVPLLTAALQEAIAKIEVLETKVAALEAG
jgi:hypothetical protein